MLERARQLLLHHACGTIGVAISWECGVLQRGARRIAVVLEDHHVLEAWVLRQVHDPVAVGAEHLRQMRGGRRSMTAS